MAENPPLNRIYVLGYSANDRDYPIVSLNADPRVAGYKVPEDLSTCPDKRYPNHVFTGAQPLSGDERVRHVWEILPSPWVPFTRYDDDLGPIQGRRRAVKNEGQQASLASDKKVSYEGRDGSAIVSNEIEETWSIAVDEDGNSLFPIKQRDIYDERLGAIKERRQLIVYTGEESAALEYNDPTITQTTYESYNEFLSYKVITTYDLSGPIRREDIYDPTKGSIERISQVIYDSGNLEGSLENENGVITQIIYQPINTLVVDKIIEKYSVDGPQLIGNSTNAEGQLATIKTQRKAADGYVPPSPTALIRVEVSAEDKESVIERTTQIGKVFDNKLLATQKTDTVPEKFKIKSSPLKRSEEIVQQFSVTQPILGDKEYSKTEQRVSEFTVQKTTVQREEIYEQINNRDLDESWGIQLPFKEYISSSVVTGYNIEVEGLGDGNYLVREYNLDSLESILGGFSIVIPSSADVNTPRVLSDVTIAGWQEEKSLGENEFDSSGLKGSFDSLTQRDNGSISSTLSLVPKIEITFKEYWGNNIPANIHIFFLEKSNLNSGSINSKVGATGNWPVFKPESFIATAYGVSETKTISVGISRAMSFTRNEEIGYQPTTESQTDYKKSLIPVIINIPPCLRSQKILNLTNTLNADSGEIKLNYEGVTTSTGEEFPAVEIIKPISHSISIDDQITIPETNQPDVPKNGKYIISTSVEPYKFNWFLVRAVVFDASVFA
jgi:hypothetical protein